MEMDRRQIVNDVKTDTRLVYIFAHNVVLFFVLLFSFNQVVNIFYDKISK